MLAGAPATAVTEMSFAAGIPEAVTLSVLVPMVVPASHWPTVAMPRPSVFVESPVTLPPPAVTVKRTTIPGRAFPE